MSGAERLRTVAVIPARGGSQGVPGKNLRRVGGLPLVARAVRACRAATRVDLVVVTTDDDAIAAAAVDAGARVVRRPPALAGHTATSESALLHALDALGFEPTTLLFVQCTSPFLDPADLDAGVALVADGHADSAFSAVETYEFLWRARPDDGAVRTVAGVNHDAAVRPRRQDREPDWRETGGFYVMDVAGFRAAGHRFFGRTAAVAVPEATALEIDSPAELAMAEALAPLVDAAADEPVRVDAVVTDFDGVHTDDAALVDAAGHEAVRVSRADGMGVAALRAAGVPVLIVSKERNRVVSARGAKLGVEVLQGVDDKVAALTGWLAEHGLDPARVAYLGNDVNDLGPLGMVGWPVAVSDARPEVRAVARLVLRRPGGHGAVRELCDRVLAARALPT
ncbi:N-acylneuraminate cytidylyltransferase [Friedmanniella luteola]|uniref:N-acylneuraminate cytidylyltransferase n=1 Tax=Friedmanniella luteola TaxID=546871 RepID=A0A1H1V1J3_9ACTN|nr:acylneuraminate cytidylyltransferase [Friedmanniella luteola]SDS78480.1 N-acylneuraminate cytidylyltransferase [Friedmanniella luteola]